MKSGKKPRRKPLQFRVYPHPGVVPYHYTVEVYSTFKALRRADGNSKSCIAFFRPDGIDETTHNLPDGRVICERNTHLGTMAFYRAEKDLPLSVVHEAFHATSHAQAHLGFPTGSESVDWGNAWKYTKADTHEELAARWQEALVTKILSQLKARKII
jgi:hypothetical protein